MIPTKANNTEIRAFLTNSLATRLLTTPIFTFASYLSSKYVFISLTLFPDNDLSILIVVSSLIISGFIILLQQNAINQATMAVANALPLPAAMKGTSSLLEWWMVIIILAREFMVTGIRLLAAGQGKVIAANKFGKVKTTLQFITILFLLAGGAVTLNGDGVNELQLWFVIVGKVLLVATLAITIFSGYEYLVKNLDIFKDIKDKKEKKLK